jgi:hypothetical protein
MKNKRYFFCYSYPLKSFFEENDLDVITVAQNQSTGKRYWLFEGTDELNRLLKEWRERK